MTLEKIKELKQKITTIRLTDVPVIIEGMAEEENNNPEMEDKLEYVTWVLSDVISLLKRCEEELHK